MDAVFHTVPWIPGIERMPGGQLSGHHLRILYCVDWGIRQAPEACGFADIARALDMPLELVVSSSVMLELLGRVELNVRADELRLFECEPG